LSGIINGKRSLSLQAELIESHRIDRCIRFIFPAEMKHFPSGPKVSAEHYYYNSMEAFSGNRSHK